MSTDEATIHVRLPRWIVEEVRRIGLRDEAIARAAIKLVLLEEILSKYGLEEEDLEWIQKKKKTRKQ